MAILPIRLYPDPVLRQRCTEVEQFDDELRELAASMVETMHAAPGVGLAAPQVGDTRRLMVVDLSVGENPEELSVFVNPRIVEESGSQTDVEGCLSIPDLTEKVTRADRLTVEAQDLSGEPFTLEAHGWFARAIYHETDHLNGVLFVDHLRGLRREKVARHLKKLTAETTA